MGKAALLLADRSYQHSGGAATIFIVQALPYVCRTNSDPWSPNYPKPEDVVKTIESYTGIKVERI